MTQIAAHPEMIGARPGQVAPAEVRLSTQRLLLPMAAWAPAAMLMLGLNAVAFTAGRGLLAAGIASGVAVVLAVGLTWQLAACLRLQHAYVQLRGREQHYRRIVVTAHEGIFQLNEAGAVTFANPTMAEILGYSVEELIGSSALRFIADPDKAMVLTRLARRRQGAADQYEVTCQRKDGAIRWVRLSANPLVDEGGRYVGSMGLMTDITEQRAVVEARARLAAIVESSDDAITSTDRDGLFVTWNKGATKLYGYGAEEAIGRHVSLLLPPDLAYEADLLPSMAGHELNVTHYETERLCKDGSRVPVSVALSPMLDADGEFAGGSAIARDITDLMQAEQAQARRVQYAALRADASSAWTASASLAEALASCCAATVQRLNAAVAQIWLLRGADTMLELQAQANPDGVHVEGSTAHIPVGKFEIGRVALEARPHMTNEVHGDPHAADRDWMRNELPEAFAGCPLLIAGRVQGVLAIFARMPLPEDTLAALADVADLVALGIERARHADMVRAKEEAEQANHAKSQFLSRMSHELRTPLNAVLGFAQVLQMSNLPDDAQQHVCRILRGGHHLLNLINDVLDISRIESGNLTLSVEPVPLAPVLAECLELIASMAQEAGVALEPSDLDICVDVVRADRQRLKQVFLNLLSNAVKYNRPGGRVMLVRVASTPDVVKIGVRDTGTGLEPAQLARLFRPFDRLGAESTRVEGTGLGLALSKALLDTMHGSLTVESTVGAGSTFWVSLEQAAPLAQPPEGHPSANEQTAASRGRRSILYVGYDLLGVGIVQAALELYPGVELHTAATTEDGLRAREAESSRARPAAL